VPDTRTPAAEPPATHPPARHPPPAAAGAPGAGPTGEERDPQPSGDDESPDAPGARSGRGRRRGARGRRARRAGQRRSPELAATHLATDLPDDARRGQGDEHPAGTVRDPDAQRTGGEGHTRDAHGRDGHGRGTHRGRSTAGRHGGADGTGAPDHDTERPQQSPRPSPSRGSGRARATGRRKPGRRLRTVDETSAGGLVVDSTGTLAALIGRLDRRGRLLWSLPKGHLEDQETAEQAAVREVAEETGIDSVVVGTLGTIDYWFVAEDRRVHKTVHHFLLRALGGELSDEDVEVTEVAWVPLTELDARLAYADERRLVRRAADLLSEPA
jgi:ADP-ribose pyrophosphatase YjhB (NUDIX family)